MTKDRNALTKQENSVTELDSLGGSDVAMSKDSLEAEGSVDDVMSEDGLEAEGGAPVPDDASVSGSEHSYVVSNPREQDVISVASDITDGIELREEEFEVVGLHSEASVDETKSTSVDHSRKETKLGKRVPFKGVKESETATIATSTKADPTITPQAAPTKKADSATLPQAAHTSPTQVDPTTPPQAPQASPKKWPERISPAELGTRGYYMSDPDENGFGGFVLIPEISGVTNAVSLDGPSDRGGWGEKSIELHESGLVVSSYYGKRGLSELGDHVRIAEKHVNERPCVTSIARIINPREDGSGDLYCIVSSSPEYGVSISYVSETVFSQLASEADKQYYQTLKATAKLAKLQEALVVLREMYPPLETSKDEDNFSTNGDEQEDNFSTDGDEDLEEIELVVNDEGIAEGGRATIAELEQLIKDAEEALKPESKYPWQNRVNGANASEILDDYFAEIRKIVNSDLGLELGALHKVQDRYIDSVKLLPVLDLLERIERRIEGGLELFVEDFEEEEKLETRDKAAEERKAAEENQKKKRAEQLKLLQDLQGKAQNEVQDLYPTRSVAIEKVNKYSLGQNLAEFVVGGALSEAAFEGVVKGAAPSAALSKQQESLKKIISESENIDEIGVTREIVDARNLTLTDEQKESARRVASAESFRKCGAEIERATARNVDFSDDEKIGIKNEILAAWEKGTWFVDKAKKQTKDDEIAKFLAEAKLPNSPHPGPSVLRSNKRGDVVTVAFNGAGDGKEGYEGDDIMYLHVRGTLPPSVLYVKVQVATSDGQLIKVYKNGVGDAKPFNRGDIAIDEATVYTKDKDGNYLPQNVSDQDKADQSLYEHMKVKAVSVIDGQRKAAILFDGHPIAPQNLIAKVEEVSDQVKIFSYDSVDTQYIAKSSAAKTQIEELRKVDGYDSVSIVTKMEFDPKKPGQAQSGGALYVQDARDPNNIKLFGPVLEGEGPRSLGKYLEQAGVPENGTTLTYADIKGLPPLPASTPSPTKAEALKGGQKTQGMSFSRRA